jgi:hypothetical protein
MATAHSPAFGELLQRYWRAAGLTREALAVRQRGAAMGLHRSIASPLSPSDREVHERILISIRAALGEAAFAREWALGGAKPLNQVIQEALAL